MVRVSARKYPLIKTTFSIKYISAFWDAAVQAKQIGLGV